MTRVRIRWPARPSERTNSRVRERGTAASKDKHVYLVRLEWTCKPTRPTSPRRSWTDHEATIHMPQTAPRTRAWMSRQADERENIHKSSSHAYARPRLRCRVWCVAISHSIERASPRCAAALKPTTLYKRLGLVNAHQSVGCFVLPEGTLAEFRKMHESVRVCLVL